MGEVLSWHVSSFIEIFEDGIRNSVWLFIYFPTLSCWLVDPILFYGFHSVSVPVFTRMIDFPQLCVCVDNVVT